jgi:hypothetical protein
MCRLGYRPPSGAAARAAALEMVKRREEAEARLRRTQSLGSPMGSHVSSSPTPTRPDDNSPMAAAFMAYALAPTFSRSEPDSPSCSPSYDSGSSYSSSYDSGSCSSSYDSGSSSSGGDF